MTTTLNQIQEITPQFEYCEHPQQIGKRWFLTKINRFKFEFHESRQRFIFAYGQDKEILHEMAAILRDYTDGDVTVKAGIFAEVPTDLDLLPGFVEAFVEMAELYSEPAKPQKVTGVTFKDTDFENYGERDFMAAITQATKKGWKQYFPVGKNLVHEYQANDESRIDAVELNEDDTVKTVIECQSGIQNGEYLDSVHFEKAISRYPHTTSAQRVIIIAGGYSEAQLATFTQLPFEIIALTTTVVDGQIELV